MQKFVVSPNCFFPKPKVTSMIIHFKPLINNNFKIKKIKNIEKVTNVLFSNRRKMINKNLNKVLNSSSLKKIPEINLNARPSELKPEIYFKITELYEREN